MQSTCMHKTRAHTHTHTHALTHTQRHTHTPHTHTHAHTHTETHTHTTHTHTHACTHTHTTHWAVNNNALVHPSGERYPCHMLNVHWPLLLHLEVLIHSVEAAFSHHKDTPVSLEALVEFLNDCRVERALVPVHSGQSAHLEWEWGWKHAQHIWNGSGDGNMHST